jgi:hypothetical protein
VSRLDKILANANSRLGWVGKFDERVKRLSRVKYAKEREMLHDIVSSADVVRSPPIMCDDVDMDVLRFAPHALLPHAQPSMLSIFRWFL